eukprot:CAMPEP_0202070520 /NCGR_PEP_ID=MMETSP0964-20121228/1212_1 /ASSEMBLY_ACC=CAM_ASM_000500 /TAXON_ID=4773 /ORGANISM="Schizochytrium aggregatum, Strain ATCC28209" /LENGTH=74 /DNA_ID=CAMNT_0048637389 /DNA_START=26 /DNA_END=248 /DNA_ORIENTATION=+
MPVYKDVERLWGGGAHERWRASLRDVARVGRRREPATLATTLWAPNGAEAAGLPLDFPVAQSVDELNPYFGEFG